MLNHFDTEVTLRTITRTQNTNGYPIEDVDEETIWGELRSVTRTEFYAAEAQGHKLACVVTVPSIDYNGAEEVEINGLLYKVVRVYWKTLDLLDLTLERF